MSKLEKHIGYIKPFDEKQNLAYRFITHQSFGDVFFHKSKLVSGQKFHWLREGVIVEFELETSATDLKKTFAIQVKKINIQQNLAQIYDVLYSNYNLASNTVSSQLEQKYFLTAVQNLEIKDFQQKLLYSHATSILSEYDQIELIQAETILKLSKYFFPNLSTQLFKNLDNKLKESDKHDLWIKDIWPNCQIELISKSLLKYSKQTIDAIFSKCSQSTIISILVTAIELSKESNEKQFKVAQEAIDISKYFNKSHSHFLPQLINLTKPMVNLRLWIDGKHNIYNSDLFDSIIVRISQKLKVEQIIYILKKLKNEDTQSAVVRQLELQFKEQIVLLLDDLEQYEISYSIIFRTDHFVTHRQLKLFEKKWSPLYQKVCSIKYLELSNFGQELQKVFFLLDTFDKLHDLRKEHNLNFVNTQQINCKDLLTDVGGLTLDEQQQQAVLTEEDNVLVIAGAGSGKTLTIQGKVKYLIERKKLSPEDILLISFTNKSADEMSERISADMAMKFTAKTFHKLGTDIISEAYNEKPTALGLIDSALKEAINTCMTHLAKNDKNYEKELADFLTNNLKCEKDMDEFETAKEYIQYLKEQDVVGLKIVNNGGFTYRERYKSFEELKIANFLFRNKIKFKYEEPFKYKTASKKFGQYKPDFFLPDYNIYIEHYGIDKHGNVPSWFRGKGYDSAQKTYNDAIQWKEQEHKKRGTVLLKTYSWENKEGKLITNLRNKLIENNIRLHPMSSGDVIQLIKENDILKRDYNSLTNLIHTFLGLVKGSNIDPINLDDDYSDARSIQFLNLFKPIYREYQDLLRRRNEIDFNDMINDATEAVVNNSFNHKWKYIIIDEFQDISKARFNLVTALIKQQPNTKLFCVGDDWQSIYRFAGSDISFFTAFSDKMKYNLPEELHRGTEILKIEKTYRFNADMIDVSSKFIQKNYNQQPKTLIPQNSSIEKSTELQLYESNNISSKAIALDNILTNLINISGDKFSLLLIGRYSKDFSVIEHSNLIEKYYVGRKPKYRVIEYPEIKLKCLTVHSSKGLQSDYSILLNCESGIYGFPSEINDDPLIGRLLPEQEDYPNAEERRVFYVAMTRAKRKTYFLVNRQKVSKFIDELFPSLNINENLCPWCESQLKLEEGFSQFYACTNDNSYCNYTCSIDKMPTIVY